MAEPIIDIRNLSVIYNEGKSNEVRSLENVSVQIFPEEYVVIFGPSGCGKSTLLYTISGLQSTTTGEVFIEGKDIAKISKKEMVDLHQTGIGMIFQAFYLISSLKIIENVCLPKIFRGSDIAERKEAGMNLLRRFGIAEQANKFPSELSGGQKQRVAISRSLINDPQIILADEPVGNLDSESSDNVMQILKELNEVDKKTIILVTHSPEHLHYADRILHMKDGRLVSEEINKDKRSKDVIEKEIAKMPDEITNEMKLLMRTFKNFSPQQIGALLIPYKAKQLLTHILSQLTDEQMQGAESFLKDLLFKSIDIKGFEKNLDLDLNDGGASWNKLRAKSFSEKVSGVLGQVEAVASDYMAALEPLTDYLLTTFKLNLDPEKRERLTSFLKLRLENRIDCFGLQERLDAPAYLGGVGLYKNTAEKVVKEVEIILLLKYTGQ
jgi:putative ABC transport system ATP-binding protein